MRYVSDCNALLLLKNIKEKAKELLTWCVVHTLPAIMISHSEPNSPTNCVFTQVQHSLQRTEQLLISLQNRRKVLWHVLFVDTKWNDVRIIDWDKFFSSLLCRYWPFFWNKSWTINSFKIRQNCWCLYSYNKGWRLALRIHMTEFHLLKLCF